MGNPQGTPMQSTAPQSAYSGGLGQLPLGGAPMGMQNAFQQFQQAQNPMGNLPGGPQAPMTQSQAMAQMPMQMPGNLPGSPQGPMSQSQAMMTPMGAPQTPPPGGMPQGYGQNMNAAMQYYQQNLTGQQPMVNAPLGGSLGGPQGPMSQSQAMMTPMGAPQTPPPGGMPQGVAQNMANVLQQAGAQLGSGKPLPPRMPTAPNVQQTRMEDPRMTAMRNMQRMRGYNR